MLPTKQHLDLDHLLSSCFVVINEVTDSLHFVPGMLTGS